MIKKIVLVFLLAITTNLFSQRTNSSPYSFFGIGDQYSFRTVENASMGGIGASFNHYKYLNFTNPAANAFLKQTTYSLAALSKSINVKTTDTEASNNSLSLSYVALGFPLGKKAGFSFGLQPVSSVGYTLNNTITDADGAITDLTIYDGSGGVNRVFGSFGYEVFKGFALGIEADFSFGTTENSVINQKIDVSLATKNKEENRIRGNSVSIGAQYKTKLKENTYINFGSTFKLGNDFTTTGNEYLYSLTTSTTGNDIPRDTTFSKAVSGVYSFPLKTTLGAGIGKLDKWHIGVEFENQDAIETSGTINGGRSSFRYENSSRVSLGGFYLPRINSISSYWDRVTYRAGLRFEKLGLAIDGQGAGTNFTSINDFGMSFGLGLPLKQLSDVNLGFEFGQRGTTSNNLIKENYFNFRLSLSLSDTWFRKRKID